MSPPLVPKWVEKVQESLEWRWNLILGGSFIAETSAVKTLATCVDVQARSSSAGPSRVSRQRMREEKQGGGAVAATITGGKKIK